MLTVLISIALIDNIAVIVTNTRVYVADYLRAVIFIVFVRSVRESFRRIYDVLK